VIELKQVATFIWLQDGDFLSRLPNVTQPFFEIRKPNLFVGKDATCTYTY
jgi:hypothetical protein